MWTKFRHEVVYFLLAPFFRIFLRLRYGFTGIKCKLDRKPYLILFNHPTNFDPMMVAMSIKGPIYFMATDDIFSIRFISPIIRYLVAPIPKSKSYRDLQAIKDTIKVVKEGGKIALSPEGNRTYSGGINNIDKAIVKLARHLKIPVVLYTIKGGFGVHPRFATNVRRGRMFGEVSKLLSVDAIKNMSDDELHNEIVQGLTVNDLDLNQPFKGKKLAERLERIFYLCPVCESISTLSSEKNHFRCSKCDLDVQYTEYLKFKTLNKKFRFTTVIEWYKYQESYIRALDINHTDDIFSDEDVTLKKVIKNRRKYKLLTGKLSMNSKSLIIENKSIKHEFQLEDISAVAVMGQNKLNFYIDRDIYQLKSNNRFNGLKYMYLYFHIKNTKQGVENEFLGI